MSWLSTALKRNKLDVLNKIAKPIQGVVNPMLDKLPGISSVKAGAEALGGAIPGAPKPVENAQMFPTLKLPGVSPAGDIGGAVPDWLKALLVGGQGINAAQLLGKSLDYAKNAEGTAMSNWNANAPLREAGRAGMLNPKSSVDTSALPGIRSANPFARGAK